ncbi:transcriptional regulator [Paenibacillus agaridevorans]|uniref:Transcriptional regulator n=1 Tax=Paenibacillus agaridevorans TaxID=171404 RepID=A0A2R5ELF9_9BACL|nr:metalloregulator ArsR/SmtB family transcription factor [Paenibacillus agaridevorans]GBG07472.1 transcriptional regulator [Paenibacillus agaridevorans]
MDYTIQHLQKTSEMLKTLGHPERLCIVTRLARQGSFNVAALQDCMSLPQSTVSTHLQKLRAAGIVEARRQGLEVTYSLKNEQVKQIVELLFQSTEGKKHE